MRNCIWMMCFFPLIACGQKEKAGKSFDFTPDPSIPKIELSEAEWKAKLTEEEYYILREKGTERPFTGEYYQHDEKGVYTCGACGYELFSSDTKFDAHCGWPSFYDAMDNKRILYKEDRSHGMVRTEVMCARCGGHLGHLFDDGPQDKTGLRYCINSVSLDFKEEEKK